jgi:hypothetical protein
VSINGQEITRTKYRGVELPEPWRSAEVVVVLPTYQEADNLPVIMKVLMGSLSSSQSITGATASAWCTDEARKGSARPIWMA